MIIIIGKKYIENKLIATFQYETDSPIEISEKYNMLKNMGFQEITVL